MLLDVGPAGRGSDGEVTRPFSLDVHARDAVIVAFTELKPHVTFVERGTVHNDEQTSGADRVFAFEVK